jgi:hypothetical protein
MVLGLIGRALGNVPNARPNGGMMHEGGASDEPTQEEKNDPRGRF